MVKNAFGTRNFKYTKSMKIMFEKLRTINVDKIFLNEVSENDIQRFLKEYKEQFIGPTKSPAKIIHSPSSIFSILRLKILLGKKEE